MKQKHVKGVMGPGGPRCSCCGGHYSHRERSRIMNSARRHADRDEIAEQVEELPEPDVDPSPEEPS